MIKDTHKSGTCKLHEEDLIEQDDCKYYGRRCNMTQLEDPEKYLKLATSPEDYVKKYNEVCKIMPELFEYRGAYYWVYNIESATFRITKVSNFYFEVISHLTDDSNPEQPKSFYLLKIIYQTRQPKLITVKSESIGKPSDLTKTIMSKANASWSGPWPPTGVFHRLITGARAPEARIIKAMGYDPKSRYYVFKDIAIDTTGQLVKPDELGYFQLPDESYLKPEFRSSSIIPQEGCNAKAIYKWFHEIFGESGDVILLYVTASFFYNQIKDKLGFFPALLIKGNIPPYFGQLLNSLQMCRGEGLFLTQTDKTSIIMEKLSQRSGLSTILKGLRGGEKYIDTLLRLCHRDNVLEMGGRYTYRPPMRSSLIFLQEKDVFREKHHRDYIISTNLVFEMKDEIKIQDYNQVITMLPEQLATFFTFIMEHRRMIEDSWYSSYKEARKIIWHNGKNKIIDNHTLILAFYELLGEILSLDYNIIIYVNDLIGDKLAGYEEEEANIADHFFGLIENTNYSFEKNENSKYLHVDLAKGLCFINLPGMITELQNREDPRWGGKNKRALVVKIPPLNNLQQSLKGHPSFVASNEQHYFKGGQRRAWVFDLGKMKAVTKVT